MKFKKMAEMPKLRFPKKYFQVLELLGAEPELEEDMAVCNELDLKDAITNLEIHIEDDIFDNDEEVFRAIDELGLKPYHLLEHLRRFIKTEK